MNMRQYVLVGFVMIGLLGAKVMASDRYKDEATIQMHYIEADYPIYESLSQMTGDSDLVVVGQVKEVRPAYRVVPDGVPVQELPKEKADNVGFFVTEVVFVVQQNLMGDDANNGQEIVVIQLGGGDGTNLFVMEQEPISEVGKTYLLFLDAVDDVSQTYTIVGGPQGRYLAQRSLLTMVSEEANYYPLVTALVGMNVDDVTNNFDALLDTIQVEIPEEKDAPVTDSPLIDVSTKPLQPSK
ncbi:MAG TPA: hypothetical protein VLL52_11750 [Anaerolineae bacterium]|nr:hypothetical protein [Anaerolineae bacterium]